MIDHGRVIARGTADELKAQIGGERVEVVVHDRDADRHRRRGAGRPRDGKGDADGRASTPASITVPVTGGAKLLAEVIRELDGRGIEIDDIGLRRPTLDDVFLSLTGHAAEARPTKPTTRPPAAAGRPRRSRPRRTK